MPRSACQSLDLPGDTCTLRLRSAETCNDPEERFIRVLQYYLAGWHIKPKGVKKPYVLALRTCVRVRALTTKR